MSSFRTMSSPKGKRGERQREKIIKISSTLMSKYGYNGTSFQMIADRAGIHKSTIFHYFNNKEDLLMTLLRKSVEDVTKNLISILETKRLSPAQKLEQAMINHMDLLVKYIDNVTIYFNEAQFLPKRSRDEAFQARKYYASRFEQIIKEMKDSDRGYFRGLDSKIVTLAILGMCNWVMKWYKKSGKLNIREITDIFFRIIVQNRDSKEKATGNATRS